MKMHGQKNIKMIRVVRISNSITADTAESDHMFSLTIHNTAIVDTL